MMQLPQSKIDFYRTNGFVQIDNVFSPAELAELAGAMDEIMISNEGSSIQTDRAGGNYYKVLNQRVNTWRDHGVMAKYSLHPRLADLALQLTDASGIRLFHDHALWKMPGDSKPTPWHQDFPYWPMNESGALSAWIPMHDVDEANGCMMFVPGSHTKGKLTGVDLVNPQDIFEFEESKGIDRNSAVKVPLKAGSITFHNGLCFHYAHANNSDQPRRVLALIFFPDGTTFNGKPHIITNDQGLVEGQPIAGGLYPLIAKK
jgi:ectoine hydroxylase-related dioxygenase (phytanoyl-CoA dioxygenase family)